MKDDFFLNRRAETDHCLDKQMIINYNYGVYLYAA